MTKIEPGRSTLWFRYSGFVIPSTFVIRASSFFHHRVPLRLEFRSRFPFGKLVGVRGLVADFEEQAQIFRRAGKVPLWIHFVRGLVIMLRHVFILFLLPKSRRLADNVATG